MSQDKISRLSDSESNVKAAYEPSYSERWSNIRPTKTIVAGIAVAAMILTMIVGFNWGGWVTGGAAQKMTTDAVTQRLAVVCVSQYNQDSQKDQKLTELQDTSSYKRDDYVLEQGWATMPGEANPDSKVADQCAKLIVQSGQ
jgi:hypothetical protein